MICSNITRDADGTLRFAGQSVPALAEQYGTPLYLMDEDRVRFNCRMYRKALRDSFADAALPLYASKACSFKQMYRIMAEEGMGVDTVSAGEIHTALAAGFPAERIWFHGDGKTDADIRYAVEQRVGRFIVDNETELLALAAEVKRQGGPGRNGKSDSQGKVGHQTAGAFKAGIGDIDLGDGLLKQMMVEAQRGSGFFPSLIRNEAFGSAVQNDGERFRKDLVRNGLHGGAGKIVKAFG